MFIYKENNPIGEAELYAYRGRIPRLAVLAMLEGDLTKGEKIGFQKKMLLR